MKIVNVLVQKVQRFNYHILAKSMSEKDFLNVQNKVIHFISETLN